MIRVSACDPAPLDTVEAATGPTQSGRILGTESIHAHKLIYSLTGIEVQPVVRFYTTQWGMVKPHKDAPSFNTCDATRTLIVYMSDCDGGDLFFETGDHIETKRGVVVVFDKNITHWTDPVADGVKRCVVCDVMPTYDFETPPKADGGARV